MACRIKKIRFIGVRKDASKTKCNDETTVDSEVHQSDPKNKPMFNFFTHQHVPEKATIVDAENLSSALSGQALVDESKGGVSSQESWHGHANGSGLGEHVLLLGATDNDASCGNKRKCGKYACRGRREGDSKRKELRKQKLIAGLYQRLTAGAGSAGGCGLVTEGRIIRK